MAAIHLSTHVLFPTIQVLKTQQRSTLLFLVFLCQLVAPIKIIFQQHNHLKSVQEVRKTSRTSGGERLSRVKIAHPTGNEVPAGFKSSQDRCCAMGYAAFYSVVDSDFLFFSVFSLLSMQRVALGGSWSYFTVSYKQRSGRRLQRRKCQ